jgi:hypothetical protein
MLSSIPGVAMKATSTGMVVGVALEDFDETRAYSDTYISQFGENIIVPEYVPVTSVSDPRITDGCYYGGGGRSGEAPCVPLVATNTADRVTEADRLAAAEAKERALRALARTPSERLQTEGGREVRVGQITMFVDLRYRAIDDTALTALARLMAAPETAPAPSETIIDRLVALAESFVDGVLAVVGISADRIDTKELCVDGVCVTADDLRALLEAAHSTEVPIEVIPATDTATDEEETENPSLEPETGTSVGVLDTASQSAQGASDSDTESSIPPALQDEGNEVDESSESAEVTEASGVDVISDTAEPEESTEDVVTQP